MTGDRPSVAGLARAAGHLALWVGLYFVGAYIAAVLLLGGSVRPLALAATGSAGVGLYLLDRVKLRDGWLDPADIASDRARHRFLRRFRRPVRAAAWCILGAGSLAAIMLHPSNAVLPVIGIGGVILYSKPARRASRPKDRAVLKNLLPALAIASLAVILAQTSVWHAARPVDLGAALVFAGLVLQVGADAMLCDLDDAETDRRYGTQTLALALGRDRTFALALLLQAVAGCCWVSGASSGRFAMPAGPLVAANVLGTGMLWLRPRWPVRDLVDLKLPAAAAVAWALTALAA